MPGLGGAVEAGRDVEWGRALERTGKKWPEGAVVAWKGCAGEGEALKRGITNDWFA